MGCWAIHSFGNDDAADWIADLVDGSDLEPARTAFARVLSADDYLEAPDASQALAAAEVVAAAFGVGRDLVASEDELTGWLARVQPRPTAALRTSAVSAIDRLLAEKSELRELWEDSQDYDAWRRDVEDLRSRLSD